MNLRQLMEHLTTEEKHDFAERAGTTYIYLLQCTGTGPYARRPSPRLCRAMVQADPRLTLEELRPDVYGPLPIPARARRGRTQRKAA